MKMRDEMREAWLENRFNLEKTRRKRQRNRGILPRHWTLFRRLIILFGYLLKLIGCYNRGVKNALNIRIREYEAGFSDLPEAFDGYRILHLTDLHLNIIDGLDDIISRKIAGIHVDLCVLTGDYRKETDGEFRQVIGPMKKIIRSIQATDGIVATLGNHDTYLMVKPLSKAGITVLTNESVKLSRGPDEILVTGVDDVYYYYSPAAEQCLENMDASFKIALVHSPALYDVAAANGYQLYLCGHTHGGQICLPGGIPVITHVSRGKKYFRGWWQVDKMKGYTSTGAGTSGIPVRFYSESEITLITLRKE
ncbi:MAG: metallophosphoesterase [Bacteroidota bacterium]